MNLNDVSRWIIFIDNVDGELCMNKRKGENGRDIEVVASEEIEEYINKLKEEIEKLKKKVSMVISARSYDRQCRAGI